MRISFAILYLFFFTNLFAQDKPNGIFSPEVIDLDCDEIVGYEIKNNRLIKFDQNKSGYSASFIFQLTCCAEYEISAYYSGDSLFLDAHQINNVSCDCHCYFKTTLSLPFLNPKLVFWENGEYLGIDKTEYIEYPVSFEIFEGDTINFRDKFKRMHGKFILGEDKRNPEGVAMFEIDSLIQGWRILKYHENNTARVLKTYNTHNVGDRATYTYLDSNQNVISECYRYYPNLIDYFEFCSEPSEGSLNLPDSAEIDYLVFINDTTLFGKNGIRTMNYDQTFNKASSTKKTSYIILMENGRYTDYFLSKLEAVKNERFQVFRKVLKNE